MILHLTLKTSLFNRFRPREISLFFLIYALSNCSTTSLSKNGDDWRQQRTLIEQTTSWQLRGRVNVEYHDKILAITSHLPHLIAYTIVGTASDLESDLKNDVIKFSASGFRDFTRIASSDPIMCRDIFLNNSDAVLEMLQRFNEDLSSLQKSIRKKESLKLHEFFSRTRSIRKKIIDAGQS